MKSQKGITLIALILIIVLVVAALIFIFNSGNNNGSSNGTNNGTMTRSSSAANTNVLANKSYGLGDTILFDGLELTFDSTYSFDILDNRYSEYNGSPVIKLGVTVKNISSEKNSLNMFYYSLFGSHGTELKGVSTYFDDNIDFAGELKPGSSYKSYFYILYDGNGNYSIDFDNYSQEASVEFYVTR